MLLYFIFFISVIVVETRYIVPVFQGLPVHVRHPRSRVLRKIRAVHYYVDEDPPLNFNPFAAREGHCSLDYIKCKRPFAYSETFKYKCLSDDECTENYKCCGDSCFSHRICKRISTETVMETSTKIIPDPKISDVTKKPTTVKITEVTTPEVSTERPTTLVIEVTTPEISSEEPTTVKLTKVTTSEVNAQEFTPVKVTEVTVSKMSTEEPTTLVTEVITPEIITENPTVLVTELITPAVDPKEPKIGTEEEATTPKVSTEKPITILTEIITPEVISYEPTTVKVTEIITPAVDPEEFTTATELELIIPGIDLEKPTTVEVPEVITPVVNEQSTIVTEAEIIIPGIDLEKPTTVEVPEVITPVLNEQSTIVTEAEIIIPGIDFEKPTTVEVPELVTSTVRAEGSTSVNVLLTEIITKVPTTIEIITNPPVTAKSVTGTISTKPPRNTYDDGSGSGSGDSGIDDETYDDDDKTYDDDDEEPEEVIVIKENEKNENVAIPQLNKKNSKKEFNGQQNDEDEVSSEMKRIAVVPDDLTVDIYKGLDDENKTIVINGTKNENEKSSIVTIENNWVTTEMTTNPLAKIKENLYEDDLEYGFFSKEIVDYDHVQFFPNQELNETKIVMEGITVSSTNKIGNKTTEATTNNEEVSKIDISDTIVITETKKENDKSLIVTTQNNFVTTGTTRVEFDAINEEFYKNVEKLNQTNMVNEELMLSSTNTIEEIDKILNKPAEVMNENKKVSKIDYPNIIVTNKEKKENEKSSIVTIENNWVTTEMTTIESTGIKEDLYEDDIKFGSFSREIVDYDYVEFSPKEKLNETKSFKEEIIVPSTNKKEEIDEILNKLMEVTNNNKENFRTDFNGNDKKENTTTKKLEKETFEGSGSGGGSGVGDLEDDGDDYDNKYEKKSK